MVQRRLDTQKSQFFKMKVHYLTHQKKGGELLTQTLLFKKNTQLPHCSDLFLYPNCALVQEISNFLSSPTRAQMALQYRKFPILWLCQVHLSILQGLKLQSGTGNFPYFGFVKYTPLFYNISLQTPSVVWYGKIPTLWFFQVHFLYFIGTKMALWCRKLLTLRLCQMNFSTS